MDIDNSKVKARGRKGWDWVEVGKRGNICDSVNNKNKVKKQNPQENKRQIQPPPPTTTKKNGQFTNVFLDHYRDHAFRTFNQLIEVLHISF